MSKPRKISFGGTKKEHAETQARIRAGMRQLGAVSSRDLRRIAADQRCDKESRAKACWLLGRIQDHQAAATLFRVAKRGADETVMWEAFTSLGLIGNRAVTGPLLKLLENTGEQSRRQQIVYALWFLADRRTAPTLLKVLRNPDEDDSARGFAAEGLGSMRPTAEILDALTAALNDSSVNVRMSALCALSSTHWTIPDDLRRRFASTVVPAVKDRLHDRAACPGEETVAELARTILENWAVASPDRATDT